MRQRSGALRLLARFVYWLAGFVPVEAVEFAMSEWALGVLSPKTNSLEDAMREHYGRERERSYMTPEARWLTRERE